MVSPVQPLSQVVGWILFPVLLPVALVVSALLRNSAQQLFQIRVLFFPAPFQFRAPFPVLWEILPFALPLGIAQMN